jgi:hypothetical protein
MLINITKNVKRSRRNHKIRKNSKKIRQKFPIGMMIFQRKKQLLITIEELDSSMQSTFNA